MLIELENVAQEDGPGYRRWFSDDAIDLIVWHNDAGEVSGFQFCYKLDRKEYALTWYSDKGLSHDMVDAGQKLPGDTSAPILTEPSVFAKDEALKLFDERSEKVPEDIRRLVREVIERFPKT